MEERHTNAYEEANHGGEKQLSANVASDDTLQCLQQEMNAPTLLHGHIVAQPIRHT